MVEQQGRFSTLLMLLSFPSHSASPQKMSDFEKSLQVKTAIRWWNTCINQGNEGIPFLFIWNRMPDCFHNFWQAFKHLWFQKISKTCVLLGPTKQQWRHGGRITPPPRSQDLGKVIEEKWENPPPSISVGILRGRAGTALATVTKQSSAGYFHTRSIASTEYQWILQALMSFPKISSLISLLFRIFFWKSFQRYWFFASCLIVKML